MPSSWYKIKDTMLGKVEEYVNPDDPNDILIRRSGKYLRPLDKIKVNNAEKDVLGIFVAASAVSPYGMHLYAWANTQASAATSPAVRFGIIMGEAKFRWKQRIGWPVYNYASEPYVDHVESITDPFETTFVSYFNSAPSSYSWRADLIIKNVYFPLYVGYQANPRVNAGYTNSVTLDNEGDWDHSALAGQMKVTPLFGPATTSTTDPTILSDPSKWVDKAGTITGSTSAPQGYTGSDTTRFYSVYKIDWYEDYQKYGIRRIAASLDTDIGLDGSIFTIPD